MVSLIAVLNLAVPLYNAQTKKRNTCTPLKTSLEHDLIEFKSFRVLFKDFSIFVFFVGGIYYITFIIYSLE